MIDIWIGEESDLGKGYGTQMMQRAIDHCFADPAVTKILIDPLIINTGAIRFYRRLGFVDVGERRFGEDDCLVMALPRGLAALNENPSGTSNPTPIRLDIRAGILSPDTDFIMGIEPIC